MKIKESPSRIVFQIFNYAFLVLIAVICVAPLWHVIAGSISDPTLLTQNSGMILWPLSDETHPLTLKGYQLVFNNNSLVRGYANTIFYVAIGTTLQILFTSLAAYCVSRKKTLWMKYLMIAITITMFFNGGIIPSYLVVKSLKMINTRWAIIIPSMINVFNLIIVRTSFISLPASLEESAQLDGAGHITILMKIVLPLTKATIAVVALFYAVARWNEYFLPMIYLTNRKLYPLQVILKEILTEADQSSISYQTSTGSLDKYKSLVEYCTIVVATLPILCIYPFIQKYFVTGVMIGSIKG
jgi:putative aldouronate transport system permease protein